MSRPGFRRGKPLEYTGSILAGNLTYHEPKPPSPWTVGRRAETAAQKVLKREGYTCTKTPWSMGPADIWAVAKAGTRGPTARLVQVKRRSVFAAADLNEAVRKLLRRSVAAGVRREVWLSLGTSAGFVVRVEIEPDGTIAVGGKGVYPMQVWDALRRAGLAS